jgi:hypothetical protein
MPNIRMSASEVTGMIDRDTEVRGVQPAICHPRRARYGCRPAAVGSIDVQIPLAVSWSIS